MNWHPTEYDARQCMLIRRALSAFEDGELELSSLIMTLDSLLATLEGSPEEWKRAFQEEWWTLEQVYAAAIDRGQNPMDGENGQMVRSAVARLKGLVSESASGPG